MAKKKSQNNLYPWLLMGTGSLLILAAVIWLTWNILPASTPAEQPGDQVSSIETPYPQVERISLQDAKSAYDAGTAIFVDVRDEGSYRAAHIPGASNIPFNQLQDRLDELDPDQWIITYCT